MDQQLNHFLIEKYAAFLSEERKATIEHSLNFRTAHMTLLLEDMIDPHNINAIFRTGECFGIQHFHVVDNIQKFHIGKGVSKGATKWIDIHRYDQENHNNSANAAKELKARGYQLVATVPYKEAIDFKQIDLSKKTALIFGNERDGVSKTLLQQADVTIKIPMYGFTESFNVSVSAGILLQSLATKMHKEVSDWQLTDEEKENYRLKWFKQSMARPDYYQDYFVKAYEKEQQP